MSWFKVDDGFATSRPVLRIPRRYRLQTVGLWLVAGTWSAKELTDGHIPDYVLEEVAGTPALAAHLVRVGLWEVVEDGWQYVGWEKYQPTRAEVMTKREAEAERKRKWREAKTRDRSLSKVSSKSDATVTGSNRDPDHADPEVDKPAPDTGLRIVQALDQHEREMSQRDTDGTIPGPTPGQVADSEHPDPTRPDPTSTYYVGTNKYSSEPAAIDADGFEYPATLDALAGAEAKPAAADTDADGFAKWYAVYPRKVQRATAARAYAKARKKATEQQLFDAVCRFAADPNLPSADEKRFIPHPATWLNAESWADEPLPARTSPARSTPARPATRNAANMDYITQRLAEMGPQVDAPAPIPMSPYRKQIGA